MASTDENPHGPGGEVRLRDRHGAYQAAADASTAIYTGVGLTSEQVATVVRHFDAGDYGPEVAALTDGIADPKRQAMMIVGLAEVAIGAGHLPRAVFVDARPPMYEGLSPSPAAEDLVRRGVARCNIALGATTLSARLEPSDLWSGHLATRITTIERYVAAEREAQAAEEELRASVAQALEDPAPTVRRARAERDASDRGPTLRERWDDLPTWAKATTTGVIMTAGVVGAGLTLHALSGPDDAARRDYTADQVKDQLEQGEHPPLGAAIGQVRELAAGIPAATDTHEQAIAEDRLSGATSVAFRAVLDEIGPNSEISARVYDALRPRGLESEGTAIRLTRDPDSTAIEGTILVMAAVGDRDLETALGRTPAEIRARAAEQGTSELAERGLDLLGSAAAGRGRIGLERSPVSDPLQERTVAEARAELAALQQFLPDDALAELFASTAYTEAKDRLATAFAFEASEEARAYLATDATWETLDWTRLDGVVGLAALTGTDPEQVINGPWLVADAISVGQAPGGWTVTAEATKFFNQVKPHTQWSKVADGLANASVQRTQSLGIGGD